MRCALSSKVVAMRRSEQWHDETRERMWELHPCERMSALAMTIVQCNSKDTVACARGMLSMLVAMSNFHGMQYRVRIANECRDAADAMEHLHLMVKN